MATQKTRLDRELDKAAIKLLKRAFPDNNAAKATAENTPRDGSAEVPTTPDLTEQTKVFSAIASYRELRAKLDKQVVPDDDSASGGTLNSLRSRLNGGKTGRSPAAGSDSTDGSA